MNKSSSNMSTPPPKHSLSSPTTSNIHSPVLPTPSSSTSASEVTKQLRRELEQQIADKEKQLQDSSSGIGKSVLARQISQLKERLQEMDRRQQQAALLQSSSVAQQRQPGSSSPLRRSQSPASFSGDEDLSPATLEKLQKLERDIGSYRALSPNLSAQRKERLRNGLDPLPSPSTSTMLLPAHGHDSTSLLPLPPPPSGSTPTKRRSKVPNADRRNTDIEFATEIGQGLLIEVRKMQALLQERDDQLKALQAQKADLERAAEAMAKQLRQKEENEEKLKEEAWNLEVAKQELTINVSELQQNLHRVNAEQKRVSEYMEKLTTEIEHMRDREEKLTARIADMKQKHEYDMGNLRRHSAGLQREKVDYMKQVETLNSELAIAKAQSRITKRSHSELRPVVSTEQDQVPSETEASPVKEKSSFGSTPPPSPKQLPSRNQALEVETLKTSLAHAHRMVSNLRSNLHKEKTEKFELKKLLNESQETIEQLQNDPRLWVDAGLPKSSSSANNPTESGSSNLRRLRKGKRRVPVSKTRVTRHPKGGESLDDSSDAEGRRKRKDSQQLGSDASSGESEYDDEYCEEDDDELPGAALAGGAGSAATAVGFISLGSELSQSKQMGRSLGDELSAAFSGRDPQQPHPAAAAAVPPPARSDASIQTDSEPAHAPVITHEFSVQTESVQLQDVILSSFEAVPVVRNEAETQCDVPDVVDAAIQYDKLEYVEQGVQHESAPAVDAAAQSDAPNVVDTGIQYDKLEYVEQGVQHESAPAVDAAAQYDTPAGVDAEIQYDKLEYVEQGVQHESAPAVDAAAQYDTPNMVDTGIQYDKLEYVEQGVQHESAPAVDAAAQFDAPAVIDQGTQHTWEGVDQHTETDVPDLISTGVQSESMVTSDASIQYEGPEAIDVFIQYEGATFHDASAQSDIADVKDAFAQSDAADAKDAFSQSDVPEVQDMSVQSDAAAVVDSAVQSEPACGVDSSVQHEPVEIKDTSVQYDVISFKDSAVQHVPAEEPIAHIDASVQTDAFEPPAAGAADHVKNIGAGILGLGALAAFSNWGTSSDDTKSTDAPQDVQDKESAAATAAGSGDHPSKGSTVSSRDTPASSTEQSKLIQEQSGADDEGDHAAKEKSVPAEERPLGITENVVDGAAAVSSAPTKAPTSTDANAVMSASGNEVPAVDSATDLPNHHEVADSAEDENAKVYSKAETEAMIAAAIAEVMAKTKVAHQKSSLASLAGRSSLGGGGGQQQHDDQDTIPSRPASPPPQHLLSLVGQSSTISSTGSISASDKGKAPMRPVDARTMRSLTAGPQQQQQQQARPSSILSNGSEPRVSFQSSAYDTSSLRTDADPNQIGMLTQTMIGDWLWKYTRKSVGGGLSDYRHRRFFWIHPYTRTLYWSTKAPGAPGNELNTKSALVESVKVVPDYNHPPSPDVPNMSLLIKTNNRVMKLTAPNLARHQVWLDALSYLASRSDTTDRPQEDKKSTKSSNHNRGLISRNSSIQQFFRPGSRAEATPDTDHRHDEDDYDDDEPLEDVRMCCDGKHHVSKLERDHIPHRPYYRKRKSRQAMRPSNEQPQPLTT